MYKTLVIFGSILLLAGGGMLWQITAEQQSRQAEAAAYRLKYGSQTDEFLNQYDQWIQLSEQERLQSTFGLDENGKAKTDSQILTEQEERLKADIESLASDSSDIEPYAEFLYGSNWRDEVEKYKKQQELDEFVFTGSVVCTSLGGVIVGWFIIYKMAQLVIRCLLGLVRFVSVVPDSLRKCFNKRSKTDDLNQTEEQFNSIGRQNSSDSFSGIMDEPENETPSETKAVPEGTGCSTEISIKSESCLKDQKEDDGKDKKENDSTDKQLKPRASEKTKKVKMVGLIPIDKKKALSPNKPEFSAGNVKDRKESEPLNHTLMELTQQVSAIREYAASQQHRLRRFQDGYDWNIIKTFCLRIIRCIDNLDNRIAGIIQKGEDASELEQVRDELVFALESSGVERFEPEINSDYRGQEKFAEALKEKEKSNNPEKKGKIEKVIRPGYQCCIDDQNVRIVRPAQVRLYA